MTAAVAAARPRRAGRPWRPLRRGRRMTAPATHAHRWPRPPAPTAATGPGWPRPSASSRRRCSTCRPASTRSPPIPTPVVARHLDAIRRYPDPAQATAALAAAMGVDPDRLAADQRRRRGHRPGGGRARRRLGRRARVLPLPPASARARPGRRAMAVQPPQPDRAAGRRRTPPPGCGTRPSGRSPPARGPAATPRPGPWSSAR